MSRPPRVIADALTHSPSHLKWLDHRTRIQPHLTPVTTNLHHRTILVTTHPRPSMLHPQKLGEVAVAVVPVLHIPIMDTVTPAGVLVLTIVVTATNVGPIALLPTGTNDQATMYASPCPNLNGQLNFLWLYLAWLTPTSSNKNNLSPPNTPLPNYWRAHPQFLWFGAQ
jgi:hypothetical protein